MLCLRYRESCSLLVAVLEPLAVWRFLLASTGFRALVAVACGLSSCSSGSRARAQLPGSMWDLPSSGIELVSPALAGGYFTTEPPRKSPAFFFFKQLY